MDKNIGIILIVVVYLMVSILPACKVDNSWKQRIIDAELGEWRVDSKTGVNTFVIFAEEEETMDDTDK